MRNKEIYIYLKVNVETDNDVVNENSENRRGSLIASDNTEVKDNVLINLNNDGEDILRLGVKAIL